MAARAGSTVGLVGKIRLALCSQWTVSSVQVEVALLLASVLVLVPVGLVVGLAAVVPKWTSKRLHACTCSVCTSGVRAVLVVRFGWAESVMLPS